MGDSLGLHALDWRVVWSSRLRACVDEAQLLSCALVSTTWPSLSLGEYILPERS